MQTENKIKSNKILKNGVFIYEFKGKKLITQYYKIDFEKPVKIGGLNELGYMLKHFKDESLSNMSITYIDALKIAAGRKLTQHTAKVTFKNLN